LTVEQDLKLRQIKDAIENPETRREDVNTIFMALQKQNFVLANSITNLINKWPKPPMKLALSITDADQSKSGISSESKNSTSTSET
jgi:hypothetical protein